MAKQYQARKYNWNERGRPQYKRRQPPARYMATGELRPCHVCKQVENQGRTLWSYRRIAKVVKFAPGPNGWYPIKEQVNGEIVDKLYVSEQATNYHTECEAERARAARKAAPGKKRDVMERLDDIEEMLALLRQGKGWPPNAPSSRGVEEHRVKPSEELRRASQTSPSFVGSGRGQRVRGAIEHWVGALAENPPQTTAAELKRWFGPGVEADKSGSQPDPVPTPVLGKKLHERRPLNTPADPGYDPSEILTEEGYSDPTTQG